MPNLSAVCLALLAISLWSAEPPTPEDALADHIGEVRKATTLRFTTRDLWWRDPRLNSGKAFDAVSEWHVSTGRYHVQRWGTQVDALPPTNKSGVVFVGAADRWESLTPTKGILTTHRRSAATTGRIALRANIPTTPPPLMPLAFLGWEDGFGITSDLRLDWRDLYDDQWLRERLRQRVRKVTLDADGTVRLHVPVRESDPEKPDAVVESGVLHVLVRPYPEFAGLRLISGYAWQAPGEDLVADDQFRYQAVPSADGGPDAVLAVGVSRSDGTPLQRVDSIERPSAIDDTLFAIDPLLAREIIDVETGVRIDPLDQLQP